MNIYIDLDDTLIHSVYGVGRNPGKRAVVDLGEDEVYHSFLRPEALRLLSDLRGIGSVRMLTTSIEAYAKAHNDVFSLGFQDSEIIAREHYIEKIKLAYGEDWVPVRRGTDPSAVLIDNLTPNTESSLTKCAFLGIGAEQFLQIREFNGKDPDCFPEEVEQLLVRIKQIAEADETSKAGALAARAAGISQISSENRSRGL